MKCNLCGCPEFVEMNGRPAARCRECGSFERTRLLWMYLERIDLDKSSRVLHLAPERGIYTRLSERLSEENYIVADINPKLYSFAKDCRKIDLAAMDGWESGQFDLIVHSHVLEHVPCSLAYPLFHLHRLLRAGGIHVFLVPFSSGYYEECLGGIEPTERAKRFGQDDHFRRFGKQDLAAHLGCLLDIQAGKDACDIFSEEELQEANIPQSYWGGLHSGTVFQVEKYALKIGRGP